MKRKEILLKIGSVLLVSVLSATPLCAQEVTDSTVSESAPEQVMLTGIDAKTGMNYFDGSKRFKNDGPACITCHNVTHDGLIPGGLLAKDLTDVYERLGEGLTAWLDAPPFPAMVASYKDHSLTEQERTALTAFLKQAYEEKGQHQAKTGNEILLLGGGGGLIGILILISLLWMKRKKQMVKKDIFARQSKAWDAKH